MQCQGSSLARYVHDLVGLKRNFNISFVNSKCFGTTSFVADLVLSQMTKNEITCNKCANSCVPELAKQDNGKDNYGLIEAYFDSEYSSISEFGDMVRFTFSLCESCLKQII